MSIFSRLFSNKTSALLQELAALSHPERVTKLIELGRAARSDKQAAALLDELWNTEGESSAYARRLVLKSCYGSRDGARVLQALSDPSRLLRGGARKLACGIAAIRAKAPVPRRSRRGTGRGGCDSMGRMKFGLVGVRLIVESLAEHFAAARRTSIEPYASSTAAPQKCMVTTIAVEPHSSAMRRTMRDAPSIPSPSPPTSVALTAPSNPASRSAAIDPSGNAPSWSTCAAFWAIVVEATCSRASA